MLSIFTGLGSGVIGFISNPKRLLYLAVFLVSAFVVLKGVNFVTSAMENAALVESMRIELQLKDAELQTQAMLREQAEKAAAISEAARKEAEQRADEIRQIRDAILESGDERDGAIAPVLEDALRALRNRN